MKIMTFNTQHCASYLNDLKIDFDLFADTIRKSGAEGISDGACQLRREDLRHKDRKRTAL